MRRFLFLWGVVLSAFLFSCSKETFLQPNEVEETVYQKVGRMHNEGLDYVLDYIKQNKGTIMTRSGQPLSKDDILLMAEPAVKEFIRTSSESGRFGLATRVSEDDLCFDFSDFNISEIRESLDDARKDYYDRFVSIIESGQEYNQILTCLSGLVSDINDDSSLDQLSKESLLYLVEVGTSSLKYWTNKINEWFLTLNNYDTPWTRANSTRFHAQGIVTNKYLQRLCGIEVRVQGYPLMAITNGLGEFGLYITDRDVLVFSGDSYATASVSAEIFRNADPPTIVLQDAQEGSGSSVYSGIASIIIVDAGAGIAAVGGGAYAVGTAALSSSLAAAVGYVLEDALAGIVSTE